MCTKVSYGFWIAALLLAAPAVRAEAFHLEKRFTLAPASQLFAKSEAGGVECGGWRGRRRR
jgi:hypothetical protein